MLPVTTTVRLMLFILGVSAQFLCPYLGYFFFLTAGDLFRFLLFSVRFNLVFSPVYIPDLRSMVFLPDTILSPDSFPFLSVPTGRPPVLPGIPRSEILYQSTNPLPVIHICHFHSYILIFLLSLHRSPLSIVFSPREPRFRAPFATCKASIIFRVSNTLSASHSGFLLVCYLQVRVTLLL